MEVLAGLILMITSIRSQTDPGDHSRPSRRSYATRRRGVSFEDVFGEPLVMTRRRPR
jgi:hypothetical protein